MSSESRLVYVESTVFLALLKGEAGRVEDCRSLMLRAQAGEIKVITSPVTLAEVVKIDGTALTEVQEREIDLFFRHEWIHLIEMDRQVAARARKASRDYNLKPMDAIHVATALHGKASLLLTYDDHILRLGGIDSMEVGQPSGQRSFDFETPR